MSIQPGDPFFGDDAERSQDWCWHRQFPGAHSMFRNDFCREFDQVLDTVCLGTMISEAL